MAGVNEKVKEIVQMVAMQQGLEIGDVEDHHAVVDDLGFKSLDIATLTALFEQEFGVNPFIMGIAAITEIRTIAEVTRVYEDAIARKDGTGETRADGPERSRAAERRAARGRRRNPGEGEGR